MGVRTRKARRARTLTPRPALARLAGKAAVAVLAVVLAAWFLFYIDRIPVAEAPPKTERLVADREDMLVSGLADGPLMSINWRDAGRVRIDAGPGAAIELPTVAALAANPPNETVALPPPGRLTIDMYKTKAGNAGVDLALRVPKGGIGAVVLSPIPAMGGRKGFRIVPRGGALAVHALMIPAEQGGTPGQMTLADARKGSDMDEAVVVVPQGVPIDVLVDSSAQSDALPVALELPQPNRLDPRGALQAGAVGTGEVDDGRFDTLVCGTGPNRRFMLWPLAFPRLRADECAPGTLGLTGLDPFNGVGLDVRGKAFHRRDGKTQMWDGPQLFMANPIVSDIFKNALKLPLLAWAALALRALWKEARGRV